MDEGGEKRVRASDRLSNLPDSLRFEILLNLSTKYAVKTSVLSSKWRNLWRFVPGLDLDFGDFPDRNAFVSFIDTFLGYNSDSCIQNFKLMYFGYRNAPDLAQHTRWINNVVIRKIQHDVEMPPSVCTCQSLVSFKLFKVTLSNPKVVSLPSLKDIALDRVKFADDSALETVISGCPVLESLAIERSFSDETEVLTVRSQSLLRFSFEDSGEDFNEHLVVAIDAPRLQYLRLHDHRSEFRTR